MANDGSTKITNPWFEHDENASNDGKILKMFRDFRKLAKSMERDELESFVALGAYAIYWRIVEFMHGDMLAVDEADVIADDLRIEPKYVEMILNDFELFHEEDGYYISDRIQRNLERRKEKSKKNSDAVNIRWLLHAFNEAYREFFKEEPVLLSKEIESLKTYAKKIPDFKDKLRDIIYTLTFVKFDGDVNFKPCANWLLKDNNLARLLNGEFGKLRHKPTEKELKEKERQEIEAREEKQKPTELEEKCFACSGKAEALSIIKSYYEDKEKPKVFQGRLMTLPTLKTLLERFDITNKEVLAIWQD